jgi:hypothetical protein
VVKEYDKLYINDPDMKLAAKAAAESTTFRCIKATAGANGGKNRWWMWL